MLKKIIGIYDKHYKALLIIPAMIIILAIAQLCIQLALTGEFVEKGISLKGGVSVTMPEKEYDIIKLDRELKKVFPSADMAVRSFTQTKGIIIEASDVDANELVGELRQRFSLEKDDYSVEQIGSSLGKSFFYETLTALGFAFIFMAVVVVITFRSFVPSFAVILAAGSDMIVTIAILNILGVKLGTAGIAALLMLIGYSVDTDILLTTKVLKHQEGSILERIFSAVRTGLMMTCTTLFAVTLGLIVTNSEIIRQIMLILLIGLLVDLVMTWIQNAGILRYYLERKKKVIEA